MIKFNSLLFWLPLFFIPYSIGAQVNPFYSIEKADSLCKEGFSLHGTSLIYFKNNEYAKAEYPGFTALGANNQLNFTFRKDDHFFHAGMMYSFVFGQPMRHRVLPVLSYRFHPTDNFSIIMGSLENMSNHQLIQELQGLDYYLKNPLEYGLQFRFSPRWMDADVWINWRNNIAVGDSAQEQFTQGSRFIFHLLRKNNLSLDANGTLLFYHHGGQIDVSQAHVVTQINYNLGVSLSHSIDSRLYKLSYNYLRFNNDENFTDIPWKTGNGHSLTFETTGKKLDFGLGYRKFNRFYAPFGDQVFGIYNAFTGQLFGENKEIISLSGRFKLAAHQNFKLMLSSEAYYNLTARRLDYNYSLTGKFEL
ncbi:MAG: hypothetical protein J5I59_13395 [Saprospiraceae bacterium]|nr:hypothetical protein [Saprospiraceae bacterium]